MLDAVTTPLGGFASSWATLLWFTLAVWTLESFDLALPRGDSLGVSGAMNSAALLILGPLPALTSAVVGTLGAFLLRRRTERITLPLRDLGSMALALVAASLMSTALNPLSSSQYGVYSITLASSAVYLLTELATIQWMVSRTSGRSALGLLRGNLVRQTPLLLAQLSACLLTVVIYPFMGNWCLLPVVVLLVLIRQSYALLLDIRETYRTTVEVLVEAAEGGDVGQRGHADRTAQLSREIGAKCGLTSTEVERVSYAALLHDVGAIGAEANDGVERRSSRVLEGITAFEDVTRILRVLEGGDPVSESDALSAFIIGLSSDIDEQETGHRVGSDGGLSKIANVVPGHLKARAVAAALRSGHRIPAVP